MKQLHEDGAIFELEDHCKLKRGEENGDFLFKIGHSQNTLRGMVCLMLCLWVTHKSDSNNRS